MRAILSLEPVAKGRAKTRVVNGSAWAYTPTKTQKAQAELRALFLEKLKEVGQDTIPSHIPVKLLVTFCRTKSKWLKKKEDMPYRKPDLDNFLKLLMDALNGVAFVDDAQVTTMIIKKRWTKQSQALSRGKDRPGQGYIKIELLEDTGL